MTVTSFTTDAGQSFGITKNNQGSASLIECVADNCKVVKDEFLLQFEEDESNTTTFTNAPGGDSNIRTTAGADRGLSFSVTYDNTATSNIGFSTTDIVIDAGTEWNSGQEIAITLTDSDANTNSLSTETLDVSDPNRSIPTITIGTPLTLTSGIGATVAGTIGPGTGDVKDVSVSQRMKITTDGTFSNGQTIIITMPDHASDTANTYQVVNYDLSAFADATLTLDDSTTSADHSGTFVVDSDNEMPETFTLTFNRKRQPSERSRNSNRHIHVWP